MGKPELLIVLRAWVWICVLGCAFLTGCRKRDAVSPTVGIESPEGTWVRVLLFGNLIEWTLETPGGFVAEGLGKGATVDFLNPEKMEMGLVDGRVRIGQHLLCREVMLRPKDPYYFIIDGQGFRGNLYLRVNENGDGVTAINHVPLESYLLGVIGAEMHSYWEPEALKAQTVTARTYCLAIQHRFGRGRDWDVTRTQSNQVYNGMSAENARIRQAVLETTGQILIAPNADGENSIFPAYYGSSCGGHTENSRFVFGEDYMSLSGVDCPWCEEVARRRDYYWGPVFYSMKTISEQLMDRYPSLEKLERIVDVEVIRQGTQGRITQVRLIGSNGKKDTLRGEDFRLSLDPSGRKLKSALVTMSKHRGGLQFENGRGFGHGVGLCQCGAQGLARQGYNYTDILAFYYPDSQLVKIETAAAP